MTKEDHSKYKKLTPSHYYWQFFCVSTSVLFVYKVLWFVRERYYDTGYWQINI